MVLLSLNERMIDLETLPIVELAILQVSCLELNRHIMSIDRLNFATHNIVLLEELSHSALIIISSSPMLSSREING